MCVSVILGVAVFAAADPFTVYAQADKSIALPSGDMVNPGARAGGVQIVEVTPEEFSENVENVPRRRTRFALANGYYYNQLSDNDKLFYNAILEASVRNLGASDEFSKEKAVLFHSGSNPFDSLDWQAVLHAIEADHPEQLESIMYSVSVMSEVTEKDGIKDYACYVYFRPGSNYTGEQLAQMESDLQSRLDSFYAGLTLTGDDADKELIIHDALVDAIEYDHRCAETGGIFDVAHTAYGAFVDRSAVCDGYSKAFKMLLNKAGIDSEVVAGLGNGGGHAWNVVRIGDSWYEADVTWDDRSTAIDYKYYFMLAHEYFNLTTADIRSHLEEVPGFASRRTTHILNSDYMGYLEPPAAYGTEKSYRNIKKVYKITYDATLDKAVVNPKSSYTKEGRLLDKPSTIYLYGYNFDNWYSQQAGGTVVSLDGEFNGPSTIYARWIPKDVSVNLVTGLGNTQQISYKFGEAYSTKLPDNLEKEGNSFDGWYLDMGYNDKVQAGTKVSNADTHFLYARWIPDSKRNILYNANGGTVDTESAVLTVGEKYGSLPVPTRTGYDFSGWFVAKEGGNSITSDSIVMDDITLFAHWSPKEYRVYFHKNDGSNFSEYKDVYYDGTFEDALGSLGNYAREGYTFLGWFTKQEGGTQITPDTIVKANVPENLYAHWRSNQYTIVYNANGGIVDTGSVVLHGGEKYGSLPTPTRYGYTFNGWYDTSESGYRVSATDIVNRNITLCAAWTPIRTSVLFYSNFVGDNGFYQEEYADYDNTYARALGCISEPVNDGYTFLGWFTKATGGNKVTASTVVKSAEVIKLYAHWEKNASQTEHVKTEDNSQNKTNDTNKPAPKTTAAVKKGSTVTVSGATYIVTGKNAVELKTAKVSKAGAVSIPATVKISGKTYKVTGIRAKAFRKKTKIKKVTIGKNVTKIGAQAFEGCTSLTTVGGGAAVKIIDAKAFCGCKKLKKAPIGAKVTSIGSMAFYNCSSLTGMTIPVGVNKLGKQFAGKTPRLKTLTVKTGKLKGGGVAGKAFTGMGSSKTVIKVPKGKTKTYKSLFQKKGLNKKIKIK